MCTPGEPLATMAEAHPRCLHYRTAHGQCPYAVEHELVDADMPSAIDGWTECQRLGPLKSRDEMLAVPQAALPAIVLTDNLTSLISARIRAHTRGYYSHAMLMVEPGRVVSQDRRLAEWPLANYLDGKHRVKIWTVDAPGLAAVVAESLAKGGRYDWLGIVGQLLRWPRLNFGGRWYCSEWVVGMLDLGTGAGAVLPPLKATPSDIDTWAKECADLYPGTRLWGYYDPALEALMR